jgi:hypothetical protein
MKSMDNTIEEAQKEGDTVITSTKFGKSITTQIGW